jgi:hypothetical protein
MTNGGMPLCEHLSHVQAPPSADCCPVQVYAPITASFAPSASLHPLRHVYRLAVIVADGTGSSAVQQLLEQPSGRGASFVPAQTSLSRSAHLRVHIAPWVRIIVAIRSFASLLSAHTFPGREMSYSSTQLYAVCYGTTWGLTPSLALRFALLTPTTRTAIGKRCA